MRNDKRSERATQTNKLVNRYATLSQQVAPLLEELNSLKKLFRTLGDGLYAGSDVALIVDTHETNTLDQKIVKGLLTAGQIVQATRTGSRTTMRLIELVDIKEIDATTDERSEMLAEVVL